MSVNLSHFSICKKTEYYNKQENELNQLLHDIKSPLSSLNLCIKHLTNTDKHGEKDEALAIIKLAVERISKLVADDIANSEFNIQESMSKIMREYAFCSTMKITISNLCVTTLNHLVFGNEDVFKNILSNILNNSANAKATTVDFSLSSQSDFAVLKIRDNGVGIDNYKLNWVGKAGISLKQDNYSINGQGLGLSHAVETLNQWGGKLTITSEKNVGTELSLYLKQV